MEEPIVKIDEFAGMDEKGIYYLEGASARKINGKSIITPSYNSQSFIKKTDTGFSDLALINSMCQYFFDDEDEYIAGIDQSNIFIFNGTFSSSHIGKVHTVISSGSGTSQMIFSNNPGILATNNNNLLYTLANHLGMGYVGICKTGSGTTKIIDTDGRDFTTLGLGTTDGINKVYNLNNKEEYTITSITTTTSTNDTLNFSAGTANDAGDQFIAFVDNKFPFGTTIRTGNHFYSQLASTSWKRQIIQWGNYYWALNGNYVANLNVDEATFAEDAKQLPYNTQGVCLAVNGEKMLVGGSYRAGGRIMLWDGYTPGWLNDFFIDTEPQSIKPYGTGFVVTMGASIYYTDGYSWDLITTYPDAEASYRFSHSFDGTEILGDNIYVSINQSRFNRMNVGYGVYDFKSGWSFVPSVSASSNHTYYGNTGALFAFANFGSSPTIFAACYDEDATSTYNINKIYSNGGTRYSMIYYVNLPKMMNISMVELNLSSKYNKYNSKEVGGTISVSYGDGKDNLYRILQTASTGNNTTTIVNALGASYPVKVGNKVMIMQGNYAGDISWVTAIANPGTGTETLTISPAIGGTISRNLYCTAYNLKLAGEQFTYTDSRSIPDNINFEIEDFYSDKLYIEVVIDMDSTGGNIDIHGINLY